MFNCYVSTAAGGQSDVIKEALSVKSTIDTALMGKHDITCTYDVIYAQSYKKMQLFYCL